VTFGIELRDGSAVGVITAADGGIVARAARAGDLAALDVLRAMDGHRPHALGAAVRNPADVESADIIASLAAAANVAGPARILPKGAALALAEQWCGAARDARYVVALSASDCVYAGMAVDGHVFAGAHGLACAAGWLALNPVERDDYRKLGCLEAEVGAPGIVRRLVWRIKAGDRSRVEDAVDGNLAAVTVDHVLSAARDGDGVAVSVVRDTARYIGMAIGNLVTIADPDVVVLGGLLAAAGDLLIEPARAEALRRVSPRAAELLTVVPSALGDDAAAIGAARAAMLAR
jgi:glucokinase